MKVLLLVPAFNEEKAISVIVTAARRHIADVLVIDDGSSDSTAEAASPAMVLRHEVNKGKGEALKTGFAYALQHSYDYVLTIDADGQHDPEDLTGFLEKLDRYDLILGDRMDDRVGVPLLRRLANFLASSLVSLVSGQRIRDSQTGFRAYSKPLLDSVHLDCSQYDLETEVIVKAARQGFRIGHTHIRTIYADEVSRYRNLKDSLKFLGLIARLLFRTRSG